MFHLVKAGKIQFVKIKDLKEYDEFRYNGKWWCLSVTKNMMYCIDKNLEPKGRTALANVDRHNYDKLVAVFKS